MSAAASLQLQKIFVIKVILQLESTETQSIGIHEAHLFNTELAMHFFTITAQILTRSLAHFYRQ